MMATDRSHIAMWVVGAIATVVTIGAVLARVGASDPDGEEPASVSTVEGDAGRNEAAASLNAGDSVDPVGAAIEYATAGQQWLYLTDERLDAAVRAVSTPAASNRLAADVVEQVQLARERLDGTSGRIWWLVRPLAWRLDHHQGDSARVSVWVAQILSATDVAAPQVEFVTYVIDLELVDGEWLVDDVLERPGPTPINGPMDAPWNSRSFDATLDGFTRIGEEPDR